MTVSNRCHLTLIRKNKCLSVPAQSPYDCRQVNNARYTYKRMAPQATSQWAQVGIPGPRGADPVAAAADRLFAAVKAPQVAATRRNSVRAAPATLGSRHSNGSFGPFIR